MKRLFFVLVALTWAVSAWASDEWFGIYLQGQKIGYTQTSTKKVDEKPAVERRDSLTVVATQMLGSEMKVEVRTSTWIDAKGRPTRTIFENSSAGRVLKVTADFQADKVLAVMESNGTKTSRTIPIPKGAILLDDPSNTVMAGGDPVAGQTTKGLTFAPDLMDLVEVQITVKGKVTIEVKGQKMDLWQIDMVDPRAPMSVFSTAKGDVVKMTGPMGMEMWPEPKEVAMRLDVTASTDLAEASLIRPKGQLDFAKSKATLKISGLKESTFPTDFGQTANRSGDDWMLTVAPILNPDTKTTIASAAKAKPEWTRPEPRVPSDDPEFVQLAKQVVEGEKTVVGAGRKLHKFVHDNMSVNAGIGVLRDAKEIWTTKEGVCRDHAILAGTLFRAAGIPTRFVNGLVFAGDAYYYHAWIEYWDGSRWVGCDTTRNFSLNVGYIKTSQGSAAEALKGFLLDQAKIEVIKE